MTSFGTHYVRYSCGGAEVEVWLFEVEGSPPAKKLQWLDESERSRAASFAFEGDRALFVSAHVRLRQLLGDALNCPPAAVTLTRSANGRPVLAPLHAEPQLHFSLAHTYGLVAVALVRGIAIGIDVERMHGCWDEIIDAFVHPRERLILGRTTPSEYQRMLPRLWTAKEAYAKATGEGLAIGMTALVYEEGRVVDTQGRYPPSVVEHLELVEAAAVAVVLMPI